MLEETALVAALEQEGTDQAAARAENLREFLGAAQEFDLLRESESAGARSLQENVPALQQFLERISLTGEAERPLGGGPGAMSHPARRPGRRDGAGVRCAA